MTNWKSLEDTIRAARAKAVYESATYEVELDEAIIHSNSSGQGHDPEHKNHPFHSIIQMHGYSYSHSTPVHHNGGLSNAHGHSLAFTANHHTYKHHKNNDKNVTVHQALGKPHQWSTSTGGSGRRATVGHSVEALDKHLKGRKIEAKKDHTDYKVHENEEDNRSLIQNDDVIDTSHDLREDTVSIEEMETVKNKGDHDVLRAFANKQSHQSNKLSTDGKVLHGNWVGGHSIAHWDGDKARFRTASSRSEQAVHRALKKKYLAPNDIHEETMDEVSTTTLEKYVRKATAEHGMANFARRSSEGAEKKFWAKKEANRKKGISTAIKKFDKRFNEEEAELDETMVKPNPASQQITAQKQQIDKQKTAIKMSIMKQKAAKQESAMKAKGEKQIEKIKEESVDEAFVQANRLGKLHADRYRSLMKTGNREKAELHRQKASDWKRKAYVANDNPIKDK